MTATPSTSSTMPDRVLPGIGLMVMFCVIAPLSDVASKIAVQSISAGTVTLARFAVQAALMVPVVAIMRLPFGMDRRAGPLTFLRALAALGSTFCFIAAVRVMPVADALAIAFVAPFALLLLGRFVLHEQVGPRQIAASLVAFGGTILVIQPSFAAFGAVAFWPIGSALSIAFYMLVTRHLSHRQHPVVMQLHTAAIGSLLCLLLLLAGTAFEIGLIRLDVPQGTVWLPCIAVGTTAAISHLAMTYALSFAPASTLAPLNYLEIVTATLFGFWFFGDFPGGMTWTGIAIIVAAGLYVVHREGKVGREITAA